MSGFPPRKLCAPVFNVKSFGAYGDGVHDDTNAGNAAIAAAAAVGGTAYFPAGTYLGQFTSPSQSSGFVRIVGDGESTIILCTPAVAADAAALLLAMPGEVTDLVVDGNGTNVPSTTTYSVLSVGNGLDAGWPAAALRRVIARNINPDVPGNGWNLIVWLSNSASPNIDVLTLEDVTIQGPSANNYDAMAINSFTMCFVSRMRLLDLARSPNFYQGDSLDVDGLYSNGCVGIATVVLNSDVTRVNARGVVIDPTNGTAGFAVSTPYMDLADSIIGNGGNTTPGTDGACPMSLSGTSQVLNISNTALNSGMTISSTVGDLRITGGSFQGGPAGNLIRCDLGSDGSGPITLTGVRLVGSGSSEQITYSESGSSDPTVFDLVIEGGSLSPASDFTGILGQNSVGGASFAVRNLLGYNPVGSSVPGTAFALPASGTAWTNNTGVDGTLYVTAAGAVTDVVVQGVTVASSIAVGQSWFVPAGGTITFTYTTAPTLAFVGN